VSHRGCDSLRSTLIRILGSGRGAGGPPSA
jgi:hypothetical protein